MLKVQYKGKGSRMGPVAVRTYSQQYSCDKAEKAAWRGSVCDQAEGAGGCIKRPAFCAALPQLIFARAVAFICLVQLISVKCTRERDANKESRFDCRGCCCSLLHGCARERARLREQDMVACTTGNKSYLRPGDQWRPQFSATARTASRRHLSTLLPLSVASDARPVESVLTILPPSRRNCRVVHLHLKLTS
jgi:hypothetical protein